MGNNMQLVGNQITNNASGRPPHGSPFWWVFVPLFALYLATASYGIGYHIDAFTNALTGWHLGMTGSVVLEGYEAATEPDQVGNVGWIVDSPHGPISQYPPGAALLSAPLYRAWNQPLESALLFGYNNPGAESVPMGFPPLLPATLTAALATAAAMGLVAATIPLVGGSFRAAIAVGYVGGLGTGMWSVASDALWQHGPAALWIALGVYLTAKSRLWWAGLAFGAAVLTRPHLAVIAAGVGIALALTQRDWRPAIRVGLGSFAGLAVLLWYNWWAWREVTVSGGYGDAQTSRLVSADLSQFAADIAGGLLDPFHGLIPYSPFLIVLIPGLGIAWRSAPAWLRGAAAGAVIYVLLQWKANRFSGGEGFVGYRYPLEPLAASAALLFLSYRDWASKRRFLTALFWVGVVAAVVLQMT